MNKSKEIYVSPTSETLVVRFEGSLCQSFGKEGAAGARVTNGGVFDFDDE